MLQKITRIKVTAPADVGTSTLLTVTLDDNFDIPEENIGKMTPHLVAKEAAAGTGGVLDESVSISGNDLLLAKGATGFVAGDVFTVDLEMGVPTIEGVDSTP